MKVKKRAAADRKNVSLISLIGICCIMLCCLLFLKEAPVTAFAADDYHVSVNGIAIDSTNAADVLGDGSVSYDSTNNALNLSNAALQSIRNDTGKPFTINVMGVNSVTRSSSGDADKLIYSNSALTIQGGGGLRLSGIDGNDFIQCVSADGTVTVNTTRLTMVNTCDAGIVSSGDIELIHAYVRGNAGNLFRATNGTLTITDSTVKAPDGTGEITGWNVVWVRNLELTRSTLEIDAPSQAVWAEGLMFINGCNITVNSQSVPGQPGLYAGEDLVITGSVVKAESVNHVPVYAGGDLTVLGGSIEAVTNHTSAAAFRAVGSITIAGPITVSTTTVSGTVCAAGNGIVIKTSSSDLSNKKYEVYAGDTLADAGQVGTGCFNAGTDVTTDIGTNACFRIAEHTKHVYSQEIIKDEALFSAGDCTHAAVYYKSCACGGVSPNSTDIFSTEPAGHITIHHEAVEPNCSAVGNVEYWECENCHKYFSDEAAATEIQLENTVLEKAPDRHISDGSSWHFDKDTHWKTCVCGAVLDNVGHTFTWVTDREPTEQANGLKHEECPVCGYAKAAVEIPALPATTDPTKPGDNTGGNEGVNSGYMDKVEENGENAPHTVFAMSMEELANVVFTDEDLSKVKEGTDIKVVLSVEDASGSVSAMDKAAVTSCMENEYKLGQYLNIDLFKLIGNERSPIKETKSKIRITITIPENLKNTNSGETRTFSVIRVHNGGTAILNDLDSDSDTITIETDRFSTYAIVYKDSSNSQGSGGDGNDNEPGNADNSSNTEDEDEDDTPGYASVKTGDSTPVGLHIVLTMLAGCCFGLLVVSRRFKVRRSRK